MVKPLGPLKCQYKEKYYSGQDYIFTLTRNTLNILSMGLDSKVLLNLPFLNKQTLQYIKSFLVVRSPLQTVQLYILVYRYIGR